MRCFLIGPPGSGKTTIALNISSRLKIPHVSYRNLVLEFVKQKNPTSNKIEKLRLDYKPFPSKIAFSILQNHLGKNNHEDFVLEGYPKTEKEANYLVKWLRTDSKNNSITFILNLDEDEIIRRLSKRLVCPECSYVSSNPNVDSIIGNYCPFCHTKLIKRKDDCDDKIQYRIQRYKKEENGIIETMKRISKIEFIDSRFSLAEVINAVLDKLVINSNSLWEAEKGARILMEGLGLDLADPNFLDTPRRIASAFKELSEGIENSAYLEIKRILKTAFPTKYKGMVIMQPIKVNSLCAHHLLPVEYEILFGYIPKNLTIGFSKIIRMIRLIAAKPQLQEDFTQEVVDTFKNALSPEGIMVIVKGRHSCMTLRGEKTSNFNITSAVRGVFKTSEKTRNEFLSLAKFINNSS